MENNKALRKANRSKNDEFYTRLQDIETEIGSHKDYIKQFKDKIILCNCDNPEKSNFFIFFKQHFKEYKNLGFEIVDENAEEYNMVCQL